MDFVNKVRGMSDFEYDFSHIRLICDDIYKQLGLAEGPISPLSNELYYL